MGRSSASSKAARAGATPVGGINQKLRPKATQTRLRQAPRKDLQWRRPELNRRPWSRREGVYRFSRRLILVSRGPRRRALREIEPSEMSPGGRGDPPG